MGTDQATLVLYVLYVFCSSSFNNFCLVSTRGLLLKTLYITSVTHFFDVVCVMVRLFVCVFSRVCVVLCV